MDLIGDMLLKHLQRDHGESVQATRVCPEMHFRLTRQKSEVRGQSSGIAFTPFPFAHSSRFNADRFLNRFWDYPRVARRLGNGFDLFHLVDHSYSQLLYELPPERTIVTCHDLDTFQCLLDPEREPRSVFFKAMMKRTLNGFRKAGFVTCDSVATRNELLAHDLVRPERTAVVRNGVHPSCSPDANSAADAEAERIIEIRSQRSEVRAQSKAIDILHVGSTIPRKRIDVLLRVFAEVKKLFPQARLLRVGGHLTAEQAELAEKLRLRESILVLPYLERDVLAAVYRRSALVLQPSEREGFGLPLVEAMACGTPVVASDLPVLREVGGGAATYCPVAKLDSWSQAVSGLITERNERPEKWAERRGRSIAQAAQFSWAEYAGTMVGIYQEVLKSSRSEVYSRASERKMKVNTMAIGSIEGSVRPE